MPSYSIPRMMLVLTLVEQFGRDADGQFRIYIQLLFHFLAQVVLVLLPIARKHTSSTSDALRFDSLTRNY